jgi:hypothetical protein
LTAQLGLVIAQWTPKQAWGVQERDAYYSSISWDGWGGASGRPQEPSFPVCLSSLDHATMGLQMGRPRCCDYRLRRAAGREELMARTGLPRNPAWRGQQYHQSSPLSFVRCRVNRVHAILTKANLCAGAICRAWFGALYGYHGVPRCNYEALEYRERAEAAADTLLKLRSLSS